MKDKIIYFPGLNGLRAIAAIAVVISHITISLKEFNLDPYIFGSTHDGNPQRFTLAGYGVSIFFVLSGFLITFLLQSEKDGQPIDVKKFYIRRILRIWPLYYLYLIVAVLAIIAFGLDFDLRSFMLYVFYAANIPFILGNTLPLIAHYWSLGVEEQFYLFWPWVVKKTNALATFILIFIVLLIGIKIALHMLYPNSILETIMHVTRFHCMMIGALGAVLFKNKHILFMRIVDNKVIQTLCWTIMVLIALNQFHIASFIDNEIVSVIALFIIIGQANIKNRIVNLENNVFDFLGKISYSIYIIHPIIILLMVKVFENMKISDWTKYIIVYVSILGMTIFISYLLFTYFEKYFLKLKDKFVVVKSSGNSDVRI